MRQWLALAAFFVLAVAANVLTKTFGLMPIGLGLHATAGTWAAGLVLVARDAVQETSGRRAVLLCMAAGAAMSWALTSPALALASSVAFAVSELADYGVYTPMRRKGWSRAALASGLVGSLVDSIVFLTLAGFSVSRALPGQMVAKTTATVAVVGIVAVIGRVHVLRHGVRPTGA